MKCSEYEAHLVESARRGPESGEADPELRRHLDACRTCADRLERERELTSGLRALAERTDAPENEESERRLMAAFAVASARLEAHECGPENLTHSRRPWPFKMSAAAWWTLAAAASVVLLVGSWAVTRWPRAGYSDRTAADVRHPGTGGSVRQAPEATRAATGAADTAAPARAATSERRVPGSVSKEGQAPVSPRRSANVATNADSDTDDLAGFVALPAADRLPGFDSGMIVRVAIPTASLPAFGLPIGPDAVRTVDADLLVGQDGQARAIRLVNLAGPRREPR